MKKISNRKVKMWAARIVAFVLAASMIAGCLVTIVSASSELKITSNSTAATQISYGIAKAVFGSDDINSYSSYMTAYELEVFKTQVGDFGTGSIQEYEIYYVDIADSPTGDEVIIMDVKVDYEGYNKMYLLEMHVDDDQLIYGHNIWEY